MNIKLKIFFLGLLLFMLSSSNLFAVDQIVKVNEQWETKKDGRPIERGERITLMKIPGMVTQTDFKNFVKENQKQLLSIKKSNDEILTNLTQGYIETTKLINSLTTNLSDLNDLPDKLSKINEKINTNLSNQLELITDKKTGEFAKLNKKLKRLEDHNDLIMVKFVFGVSALGILIIIGLWISSRSHKNHITSVWSKGYK